MNSVEIGESTSVDKIGQCNNSVAIGAFTGNLAQQSNAVAIGVHAGETGQQDYSVSVGAAAGQLHQGTYSVAIGAMAGQTRQADYSIALNATPRAIPILNSGFHALPVRNHPPCIPLFYNYETGEITTFSATLQQNELDGVRDVDEQESERIYQLKPRLFVMNNQPMHGLLATETTHELTIMDSSGNAIDVAWQEIITDLVAELKKLKSRQDTATSTKDNTIASIIDNVTHDVDCLKRAITDIQTTLSVFNTSMEELKQIISVFTSLPHPLRTTTTPVRQSNPFQLRFPR